MQNIKKKLNNKISFFFVVILKNTFYHQKDTTMYILNNINFCVKSICHPALYITTAAAGKKHKKYKNQKDVFSHQTKHHKRTSQITIEHKQLKDLYSCSFSCFCSVVIVEVHCRLLWKYIKKWCNIFIVALKVTADISIISKRWEQKRKSCRITLVACLTLSYG